ncbi:MAG: ribosomal protein S18-alanine N-acetyltransferase [Chloroflexi bacterium]|nr:ribosomal protein S18-alanine N-acetyltransferase [Chloroflexota bacterium]
MDLSKLPYEITPMVLDDVPTVHTIELEAFSLPWSAAAFAHELKDNPSSQYLVLRYKPYIYEPPARRLLPRVMRHLVQSPTNDPALLGYGGYWMVLEEAHICTLALRGEWRGRGLGELLLLSLIESALTRQAEAVTLEVRVTNYRAQNLYAKYGFEVVGKRIGYYTDNNEDALIMTTPNVIGTEYKSKLKALSDKLRERLSLEPPHTSAPCSAEH